MSTTSISSGKPKTLPLRTAEQARQWLTDQGITATQFARDNKLSIDAVKEVLCGRSKAKFGKSHAAAIALGMKTNPRIATLSRKPPRGH